MVGGEGPARAERLRGAAGAVAGRGSVTGMSEPLRLTVVYEDLGEGWVMARVPQVPGAISQEPSREEAREAVVEVVRDLLELRLGSAALTEEAAPGSDTLNLTITA